MAKRKTHGRLTVRRFCGYEEFTIEEAELLVFPHPKGVRVWFEAKAGKAVKTLPDSAGEEMLPSVSVRHEFKKFAPAEWVGKTLKPRHREENGDPPAFFQYFDNDELCKPTVEVLACSDTLVEVRITGSAHDVVYFSGTHPDCQVEVLAEFRFPKERK